MVWYKRQYTDKTLTLRKFMCMRASEASELRKFWYFYILKLLLLSIFCRYIRYFVGTNDMLVGLHVPTNFPMYRQKSEKALLGGGGGGGEAIAPPCPPLATLMVFDSSIPVTWIMKAVLKPMYSFGKWWKWKNCIMGFPYRVIRVLQALWICLSETINFLRKLHKTNIFGMPPKILPELCI